MRKLGRVQKSIKIRIYPNKTQQKWIDMNLRNATDFHNYLLESICDFQGAFDDNGKLDSNKVTINWDIVNSNSKLKKIKDKFLVLDTVKKDSNGVKIDSLYRDVTLAKVYQQVSNNLINNLKTFRDLNRGLPRFKSNYYEVSFSFPKCDTFISLKRRDPEFNHGTPYNYLINDITEKQSSKLSHNIGWLRIPAIDKSRDRTGTSIKCFCPCNIASDDISSIRFKREATGKYYVCINLHYGCLILSDPEALDDNDAPIITGIDVNLSPNSRVTLSYTKTDKDTLKTEEFNKILEARTPYKDYHKKEVKYQRELSRKVHYSKNRDKIRVKLAKVREKIANIRLNFNRTIASYLAKNYQKIAMEDLKVSNMKKGKPKFIQRLFNDAALYQLREAIIWRCNLAAREIILVSPEYTSKTCSNCGSVNNNLTLNMRSWTCTNCNTKLNRDINAAKNIRTVGFYPWHNSNNILFNNSRRKVDTFNIVGLDSNYFLQKYSFRFGEEVVSF